MGWYGKYQTWSLTNPMFRLRCWCTRLILFCPSVTIYVHSTFFQQAFRKSVYILVPINHSFFYAWTVFNPTWLARGQAALDLSAYEMMHSRTCVVLSCKIVVQTKPLLRFCIYIYFLSNWWFSRHAKRMAKWEYPALHTSLSPRCDCSAVYKKQFCN